MTAFDPPTDVTVEGNKVTIKFTVTEQMASAATYTDNGTHTKLFLGYALKLTDEGKSELEFLYTRKLVNTADVYIDGQPQALGKKAEQTVEYSQNKLITKTEKGNYPTVHVQKDGKTIDYKKGTFELNINPDKSTLNSGEPLIVDDWLGANFEEVTSLTIDSKSYNIVKNPEYNKQTGALKYYICDGETNLKYTDGGEEKYWGIYNVDSGSKMTFSVSDSNAHSISYDVLIEGIKDKIQDPIEEEIRYGNTATLRNSGGDNQSEG